MIVSRTLDLKITFIVFVLPFNLLVPRRDAKFAMYGEMRLGHDCQSACDELGRWTSST